jgi:hypothetical protein
MKVSSPIGELPFEPRHMAINGKGVEIRGLMGAWPAHVQVGIEDIPSIVRLFAKPAVVFAAVGLAFGLARRAGSRPRPIERGKR